MKTHFLIVFTLLISTRSYTQNQNTERPNNWYLTTNTSFNQPFGSLWHMSNFEITHTHNDHVHEQTHTPKTTYSPLKKEFYNNGNLSIQLAGLNTDTIGEIILDMQFLNAQGNLLHSQQLVIPTTSTLRKSTYEIPSNIQSPDAITLSILPTKLETGDELIVNLKNL